MARLVCDARSLALLEAAVSEAFSSLGRSHQSHRLALSYTDDEGDSVSIGTDDALVEAVRCARGAGRDRLLVRAEYERRPGSPESIHSSTALRKPPARELLLLSGVALASVAVIAGAAVARTR